jgi:hypothetical protein
MHFIHTRLSFKNLHGTLNGEKITFYIEVNNKWARLVISKLFKIHYKPLQAYWVLQ